MDEAGCDDWPKMVWFGYFVVLFCAMVILCLFLQYGDIHTSFIACSLILTGDEKVVHIDAKCILSCGRILHGTGLDFAVLLKYIPEEGCSQHSGRTIRFEFVWCDELCGRAPMNWFGTRSKTFLTWLNCWKLAF